MPSASLASSKKSPSDPLSKAYQRWKSVRSRLAHTIQDYADACDTLDDALSRHSEQKSFEQTLVDLDAEQSGLEKDYERLNRTHVVLSRNRNLSKQLVPINSLPVEILSQIFQHATCTCPYELKYLSGVGPHIYPDALAGVCSIWRKIAVNSPSLWSHIDLTISTAKNNNYYRCARIWSERAKNAPLELHIQSIDKAPAIAESQVLELLAFLTPLAKRVRLLQVWFDRSTRHLVQRILACWAKHGSPGVAQTLQLGSIDSCLAELQEWDTTADDDAPLVQVDEFFRSLQSLDLEGFHIPWESKIYNGLVRLSLEATMLGDSHRLTQLQLATILRASPQLRELKLIAVQVQPERWGTREPVLLAELEALVVHESLGFVLPLICPGSKPLRLGIAASEDPMALEATRSFFNRAAIETLDVADLDEADDWFQFVRGPFEHLKTLQLVSGTFTSRKVRSLITKLAKEGTVPWPRLHTMHLSVCVLQSDIFLKLLSIHSIQSLQLHSCVARSGKSEIDILELKEMLTSVVPDISVDDDADNGPASEYLC